MTPTVQQQYVQDRISAWVWLIVGMAVALLFYRLTGFWGLFIFNGFISYITFQSANMKHRMNLAVESELVLNIRVNGYDSVRMEILRFEEQAEHEDNKLERFRKTRYIANVRSIMVEVKELIDSHEQSKNA